jgi:subtilisin family serine protease
VDPVGVDAGNETVTLLNTTAKDVVLDGWTVSDSHGDADALAGATLKAGETLRFRLRKVLLGNGGDTVVLKDPSGTVVDRVAWTAAETPKRGETLVF